VSDWPYIGIRFGLYADLMLLFGLPLFSLYALRGSERHAGGVLPLRLVTAIVLALALFLSLSSLVAVTASMAGVAISEVDLPSIKSVAADTVIGHAWSIRMVVLLGMCVLPFRRSGLASSALLSGGAGLALASLAWTGHGAVGEGSAGWIQLSADIAHLLAAGAWFGALAALLIMSVRSFSRQPTGQPNGQIVLLHRSLAAFSTIGTAIVGIIVLSGLANSYMLVGPAHVADLAGTTYGRLLIGKIALFNVMICLAAGNRFRLTPRLDAAIKGGETKLALAALRHSIMFEAGAAVLIIGLVAALGTLQPPTSL
jgi:putative copper resistance protein D